MFARIRFPNKTGLSKTYDYNIAPEVAEETGKGDYVVVESARSDYSVGVFDHATEEVDDPSIVEKSVVMVLPLPKCVAIDYIDQPPEIPFG